MAAPICIARIGAAHGVRGAVKLWTFTEDPLAVKTYGPLLTKDGARSFEVATAREAKGHLVATLKGIATREEAERLNGIELYIARDVELDAVEPFGLLAGGDAFQRRHQMAFCLAGGRDLKRPRAVFC